MATDILVVHPLPQPDDGAGYYRYEPNGREDPHRFQFGTHETIRALLQIARSWMANMPGAPIGVGDISFFLGGSMGKRHQTHRNGRCVDIRPIRKDRARSAVTIHDNAAYDRDGTRVLVEVLRAHRSVEKVLFNDRQIEGVRYCKGHDNHLHVIFREGQSCETPVLASGVTAAEAYFETFEVFDLEEFR
jgi:penicillin-insensitive murein DD-endopeptidase